MTGLDERRRAVMLSDNDLRREINIIFLTHNPFVNVFCVPNEYSKNVYTRMGSLVATWINPFTVLPVGQSHVHACRC